MRTYSYGRQSISEEDVIRVNETLRGDFITAGPGVRAFEQAICDYKGAKYCVAVANGTAALHIAALAIEPDLIRGKPNIKGTVFMIGPIQQYPENFCSIFAEIFTALEMLWQQAVVQYRILSVEEELAVLIQFIRISFDRFRQLGILIQCTSADEQFAVKAQPGCQSTFEPTLIPAL